MLSTFYTEAFRPENEGRQVSHREPSMAVESTGGPLSSLLDEVLQRWPSEEKIDLFREKSLIMKLLKELNTKLRSAREVVNDADDIEFTDRNWVQRLNYLLHDVDTVVDKINTEAFRRENERRQKNRGRILKRVISTSGTDLDMPIKQEIIKDVLNNLEDVLGQKPDLRPREGVERLPTPPIVDPFNVYDRDDDKADLVKKLLTLEEGATMIPIVGMGGIGKSTLAKLVYNDDRVKTHFNLRTWVTVSDDFDVLRLANAMLRDFTEINCDVDKPEELQVKMKACLNGKRFLCVLDDVWNKNHHHWKVLKGFLESGADGSKIIVTTRSEVVANNMASTVPLHRVKAMSEECCWKLFQQHVSRDQKLEEVGRQLVAKCGGVPLAIKVLAGMLRSTSPTELENILNNEIETKHHGIPLPLSLSYSCLPPHLKRCFTYCSIFPKDHHYNKRQITLLWMANGLLQGENMEDLGEEYFKHPILMFLFQRSSEDESAVVMHDLVHDLALLVSGEDFCIELGEDGYLPNRVSETFHLVCENKFIGSMKLDGLPKAKRLRTFLSLPMPSSCDDECGVNLEAFVKKFGGLRVLCLPGFRNEELSDSIGNLIHLRYLNLCRAWIESLPDAICTLYNLQTLLLCGCFMLAQLPSNMRNLVNLRHLDLSETSSLRAMPLHNWKLDNFRTLTKLVFNDEQSGSKIKELGGLSQYLSTSFEVVGLENVVEVASVLAAKFKKKPSITELTLEWTGGTGNSDQQKEVLDALQPHTNLEKLVIRGYGGKEFPNWVANLFFSNITEVALFECPQCSRLPPFGQLPSLRKLEIGRLRSVEKISREFYGSAAATASFVSLVILEIEQMEELQSWSLEAQAFPLLKELRLSNCPKMKLLQMSAALPSLKLLSVKECPKLEISGSPSPLSLSPSLHHLSLDDCTLLFSKSMEWGRLTALKYLRIERCGEADMDSFPEEGMLPATLKSLSIKDAPNLKSLNGKGFQHLTSLGYLTIDNCPTLERFPEEELPKSLLRLQIVKCPLLQPRLQRGKGEDWPKISHIPYAYVNGKNMSLRS